MRLSFRPIETQVFLQHNAPRWDARDKRHDHPMFCDRVLSDVLGVNIRTIVRYRSNGINLHQADRLACRIGLLPHLLWGPEWDHRG